MEFSVNTTALLGFADMMDRRWQDFQTGRTYLKDQAKIRIQVNSGILNEIFGQHEKIMGEVDAFLSAAAQTYAAGLSTGVVEADTYYRHTDVSAAGRMDANMPAAGATSTGTANQSLDASVFGDPRCPSARYQPPPDRHADYSWSAWDTFSPTGWVRTIIWDATDLLARWHIIPHAIDIIEEIVRPISGDWPSYVACADVFDNIALALGDSAACVDDGAGKLSLVWTGNASESCGQASRAFADGLRSAVDPLHQTAGIYRDCADRVRRLAELLESIVITACDEFVDILLDVDSGMAAEFFEAPHQVRDLLRVAKKLAGAYPIIRDAFAAIVADMDRGTKLAEAYGIVLDQAPVPALASVIPSLPVYSSVRYE